MLTNTPIGNPSLNTIILGQLSETRVRQYLDRGQTEVRGQSRVGAEYQREVKKGSRSRS